MSNYITGTTIKSLREKKSYTQKQLAEKLCVSDKAISKWETDRGLPDISLIDDLAKALGVSIAELFSGCPVTNENKSANMKKVKFYVCPVCGNIITSTGEGAFSCCGISLPVLEVEQVVGDDDEHKISVEKLSDEYYVQIDHEMTKFHYISFIARVTADKIELVKLYPEQQCSAYFPLAGGTKFYAFCNRHGLYKND